MVVSEGRLYWMEDAYTTSDSYPYSTPAASDLNYIRNAVKIVVDAYHGTTTFYLADPADPIAQALARVFPGLFQPLDAMPAGLRAHIRYPHRLFAMQTAMFATYHMAATVAGVASRWSCSPTTRSPIWNAWFRQPSLDASRIAADGRSNVSPCQWKTVSSFGQRNETEPGAGTAVTGNQPISRAAFR